MTAFLIPIAILVVAIIIKTGWYKERKFNWWWLSIIPILALVIWLFNRPEKPKGGTTDNTTAAAAQSYVPPPQPKEPSLRTWDKIPPEGIKVCLLRGWHTFPLGGGIKITDPDGGEIFDKPGERVRVGFRSEGWYTIHADPLGSERGVQIVARWCF